MTMHFYSYHIAGALLLTMSLIAGCKNNDPASAGTLQVIDAWTRPYGADLGVNTAIYLTLDNRTVNPAFLTGAHINDADTVELHQSFNENGVMRMRPVKSVEIPAQSTLSFMPGGNHLMVKGLLRNLAEGDSLVLTLRFQNTKRLKAVADVRFE